MKILIIGASKGLGRAFVEGLAGDDDTVVGVSRSRPKDLQLQTEANVDWICADLSNSIQATKIIGKQAPAELDVIIYNLGIWEEEAFSDSYHFLKSSDEEIVSLINTNITSAILLLKRLIPRLLNSRRPQIVLTGSTSGLPQSGRPEVAFGASKFALRGMADALREGFREEKLAVTCLQIGDLNTVDGLSVPIETACRRGNGTLIPIHDVVDITKAILKISNSSYVNEIILPPILDARF